MRIDYSEPKKSYSSPASSQSRTRKESSGSSGVLIAAVISGLVCLGIGFGSGWMLSQRSAKEAFRKALEQQSLENSPKQAKAAQIPQQPAATTQQTAATQSSAAGTSTQQSANGETPKPGDPPLSFYKTLPTGQKNNVLGSGINTKDEKTAKQPLQAAIPANMTKPSASQNDDKSQKQLQPVVPAKTNSSAAGLTVQVASHSLKSEAEAVRSALSAKGYNVGIVESNLGDKGIWYRVRVGRHLDPEAAKELAKKLGKGAIPVPDKD